MSKKLDPELKRKAGLPDDYGAEDDIAREAVARGILDLHRLLLGQFGEATDALIAIATVFGRFQPEGIDLSTIAEITGISRPTVRRHLQKGVEQGVYALVQHNGRTIVLPSAESVSNSAEDARRLMEKFISAAELVKKALAATEQRDAVAQDAE